MNNIGFTAENITGSNSETGVPSAVMTGREIIWI